MTFRRTPPVGGDGTCVRLTGLDVIAAASRKPNVLFGSLGGDLVVVREMRRPQVRFHG